MDWEILRNLTPEGRKAVLATMVRRRYTAGNTLFFEGDPGDSLHLMAKGRVAIRVTTPMGETATLTVLGPGETFGEQALLTADARRTASAVALEPAETLLLHRAEFQTLLRQHPSIADVLVEVLAAQVRRLSTLVVDAHFVDADRRVCRRLADLAAMSAGETAPFAIVLTQDDLASMAGTTRPTTNRALKALASDGLITLTRGKIVINEPQRLDLLAYGRGPRPPR